MSIELHCNHCNKLIKAPDEAGGQHGKCPYCKQSVYVPMPSDALETLEVAPLDEESERRAEELDREAREYVTQMLHDKDAPDDKGGRRGSGAAGGAVRPRANVDVPRLVLKFLADMRDSKLDDADRCAAQLKGAASKARDEVQRLMVDEIQPSGLENIPPALYKGFLKALLERL